VEGRKRAKNDWAVAIESSKQVESNQTGKTRKKVSEMGKLRRQTEEKESGRERRKIEKKKKKSNLLVRIFQPSRISFDGIVRRSITVHFVVPFFFFFDRMTDGQTTEIKKK
jgi:hypothetical protein